jgi:hypothetical protein
MSAFVRTSAGRRMKLKGRVSRPLARPPSKKAAASRVLAQRVGTSKAIDPNDSSRRDLEEETDNDDQDIPQQHNQGDGAIDETAEGRECGTNPSSTSCAELGALSRSSSILDRLVAEHSARLGTRNNLTMEKRFYCARVVGNRADGLTRNDGGQSFDEEEYQEEVITAVSRWSRYLRTLPADFFRSGEATMQAPTSSTASPGIEENGVEDGNVDQLRRRCPPYVGLALSHAPENCPDLLYVYEQMYEMKIRRGGKKDGYCQFKAVAGQIARFAVAVDVVDADIFARPGGVFVLAANSQLIRAFIGSFQSNAQASTVYSKATLLCTLCRMAKLHFSKSPNDETAGILSRLEETANLLGNFQRVEKATSRRQTAVQRDQYCRDTFIHPTDWYALQRRISQDMQAVWTGIEGLLRQFDGEIHSYMDENHSLLRKYSLLLLVYILLTGGGQRPQVYSSLQHPPENRVRSWEEDDDAENTGQGDGEDTVKLYPTNEKTPRGTFCPGVVFSSTARRYFLAYTRVIRPAVMRRTGRFAEDARDLQRTFLVHTETGRPLSGENIRNTLRYYVGGVGGLTGDLSRITVMTVRASFASTMFRSFRRGKFPGRGMEEFLSDLAETMNTSAEMLRTTYIATNGKEFDEAAGDFLRASREE